MLQEKCCVQSNLFITVTLEKWVTAIYIYIYRFPLNSTGCGVYSTFVVPPFDCHEKVDLTISLTFIFPSAVEHTY